MGYYVTCYTEDMKIDPPMSSGHIRLLNHFAKTVLDKKNEYGGHWKVTEDGKQIEWEDEIGKSYIDKEVLEELINRYMITWGYTVNGLALWYGDNESDYGAIIVKNNHVQQRPKVNSYDIYCENYSEKETKS